MKSKREKIKILFNDLGVTGWRLAELSTGFLELFDSHRTFRCFLFAHARVLKN